MRHRRAGCQENPSSLDNAPLIFPRLVQRPEKPGLKKQKRVRLIPPWSMAEDSHASLRATGRTRLARHASLLLSAHRPAQGTHPAHASPAEEEIGEHDRDEVFPLANQGDEGRQGVHKITEDHHRQGKGSKIRYRMRLQCRKRKRKERVDIAQMVASREVRGSS
jgi:hypothetical protein